MLFCFHSYVTFCCSSFSGAFQEWHLHNEVSEKKPFEQNAPSIRQTQRDRETVIDHSDQNMVHVSLVIHPLGDSVYFISVMQICR